MGTFTIYFRRMDVGLKGSIFGLVLFVIRSELAVFLFPSIHLTCYEQRTDLQQFLQF